MNKFRHCTFLLFILFTAFRLNSHAQTAANATYNWEEKEPYKNGFARVMMNNQFSFVNTKGQLIHSTDFDAARNFSNHLAAVKKGDKWGFINESGKLVIPFAYHAVYDFTDNITAVYVNKKWQLISSSGTVLKNIDADAFFGFKNGTARVAKNGVWGTMNTKGEIIFSGNKTNAPVLYTPAAKPATPAGTSSVTVCPDNIDFEYGSFQYWQCFVGQVDSVGTTNVITVNPSPPTVNRHTLFTRSMPSLLDPFGLFPINPPDGSNFALKLGNTQIGAQAEKVRYPIHVPLSDSNFSIKYDYAVVFEDPGHTVWTQPRFQVTVIDSATNTPVQCATFEYISTSGLPGFSRSTIDTGVIYKPWSTVFLSLRGYAGKTMYLDFTNADCVRRGHWGYSYIDVEKPCGQAAEINYDCDSPHVTTLTGPPGFQTYNWWDSTFSTILGTGQQVVLNPGPALNTTIWLEMIPFNNFGCTDTLPVKITGVFTANFNISDTSAVCAPHSFTFYNPYLPSVSANWDFGDGATGSGDTVTHVYTQPGTYLAKFNVVLPNGCIGSGYKLVTISQPTGSFTFDGTQLCDNRQVRFDALISAADTLIWNFADGNTLTTTQTTVYHSYNSPGIYIPSLMLKSVGGCMSLVPATDTIKVEMLDAGFIYADTKICGSTTINFTDTSYSYFGISNRYWDYGDGTSAVNPGITASHIYTSSGNYTVRLIITGATGCTDTVTKQLSIVIHSLPVAAITGPAAVCEGMPFTLNSSVTSADAINYYQWSVSNGATGTGTSFSSTFNTPGTYNFQLIVSTVNGCNDTTAHQLIVNPTPDVNNPPNQVLCSGSNTNAVNFSGAVNGTVFNWTNTAPLIGLPASGSGNISSFTASSNGNSVANAGITVTPMANGCPGPSKVFVITVNPIPNVMQSGAQAVCNNTNTSSVVFTGNNNSSVYNWTNSNTDIGLPATGSGNIASFKAINNTQNVITANISVQPIAASCLGQMQSFIITVHPTPAVTATQSANVCLGKQINLNAAGAAQYVWSPAINLSCTNCASTVATPTDTVKYFVKGTSTAGCEASDSVVLSVIKPFIMTVSPGDTLCIGEHIDIRAYNASRYVWWPPAGLNRTDIANPTVRTNVTTTYRVVGYDNHQCFTDTGFVTVVMGPTPYVNIGPDRTLSVGTPLQLNAVTSGGPIVSWMWTPASDLSCNNCPSPSTTVKNNAFYSVVVTNTFGCTDVDTIFINSFCKSSQVYIPNAFTPDGDGINDVLMVRGQGITVKSFRIFNRWGELVFERENFAPNEIKNGWNGRVRGVPATPDVFVYTAEVFCENNVVYTYKGNVTILK